MTAGRASSKMVAAFDILPGSLAAALDRYNTYVALGENPDFHK